jgi:hypothetical protein
MKRHLFVVLAMVTVAARPFSAQNPKAAMGFDQEKTAHHFVLTPTGGLIDVDVNETTDSGSLGLVRTHLRAIAREFANGVFDAPFLTHAEVPPGVPALQRLRASITYRFEETEKGGRVRIVASAPDAVHAVHEFLSYQIKEHKTGDQTTHPASK